MAMNKKKKPERQEWKVPAPLQLLRGILGAALSVAKIAVGGIVTVLLILVVCCIVVVGAAGDYLEQDVIPNTSMYEEDFSLDQTSFIYYLDSNGEIQEYEKINTSTDRQWATLDEIPESLVHAAIAIEDQRFYEHQGVDWITTVKACANMFFGSSTVGGSTITQQMIKNRTGDNEVTVQRKVEEIFRACKFESQYDKDVVMEWYLNQIFLGSGCYGVKSAAWEYFGKELDELTIAECASLISITNNPSLFSPYIYPENNRSRQLDVLWEMYDQGWITEGEYEEAKAQEMVFISGDDAENITYHTCTNCGYYDAARHYDRDENDVFSCPECGTVADIVLDASSDMYSWFTDLVLEDVAEALAEKQGMEWNSANKEALMEQIKHGGYHIYTTLDMEVQEQVDKIYSNLENIPKTSSTQQLQSAIVVIDNKTGDIVAIAGAVGEKEFYDAFSYATEQGLQTGSVMKPLTVYAPAFELGVISPATAIDDLPFSYDDGKFPLNDTRTYQISTTVLNGVSSSINAIAVNVLDMIGREYSFDFAKNKFGLNGLLESEWTSSGKELSDIGYSPLALGALSYGVTVRDMASAYATFPNDGVYREDRTFTKVYDSNGNLVLDNTQDSERILSERAANYMNYCLREVVRSGTGYFANLSTTQVAAKTGTTSGNKDRWFIGYTEYYTAAVWCGYQYAEEIRLVGNTTNPAGRLWYAVMEPLHRNVSYKEVYDDSEMVWVTVCKDSGGIATEACKLDPRGNRTQSVLVYRSDYPSKSCDKHVQVDYCVSGDGVPNEYCKQVEGLTFGKVGLLKVTEKELEEIKRAATVKDLTDNLIYLVDSNGTDKWFYGLNGNINKDVKAPYKVCTVHTAESVKPPETEPPETEPTESSGDTNNSGGEANAG